MANPYYQAHGQGEVFKLENGVLHYVSEYDPEMAGRNMVPLSWFSQYPIEGDYPNREVYEGTGGGQEIPNPDIYPPDGNGGEAPGGGIHLSFGVDEGQDFNRVRNAGVNLVFDYGWHGTSYLNKAQDAGLWVVSNLKFLTSDRMAGKSTTEQWNIWNNTKAEMANLINQVKDHSALYAYYILEEPNLTGRGIDYNLQKAIYDFVKSIDPNHAVTFSMAGGPGDLGYRSINFNACDFIIPDTYGFGDPGSGGLADLNFAASSLRSYLDSNGINTPVVFTIQSCSDPGTGWQGNIQEQIDILNKHNVATGGVGLYAWNLTDGGGSNQETWQEILDAWGLSDWSPGEPTPPGPEPPTPPDGGDQWLGGNPYYQAEGQTACFKLGSDGILRWQDDYDPLMEGRHTVPISAFYGRLFDTNYPTNWSTGNWTELYKPGSGIPPEPPPEPPTPPPPEPEPEPEPEPPPDIDDELDKLGTKLIAQAEPYLGHIFPERPEITPPESADPWGQRPYEATWAGGQQQTWPVPPEPEGELSPPHIEHLGETWQYGTVPGYPQLSPSDRPILGEDFYSKLNTLGQNLILAVSQNQGISQLLGE